MERLNGKKAFVPKNFSTVMSGWGEINPHKYVDSLINKNILFHSYDNPCTLEDYSLELGISIPYIEEIVNKLTYATLLKKEGKKYITNFPIVEKNLDIKLYNIVKEECLMYSEKLAKFAVKYFSKFKEIVNDNHFDDNQLMWVFMFIVNRYAEQTPIKDQENKIELKLNHIDSKGSWGFYMVENHDEFTGYSISENWFGNKEIGIQGISYPGGWNESDDPLFSTLNYKMCVNGTGDYDGLELGFLEYVIKNKDIKYSEIDKNHKYKIDYMVEKDYLYIENDEIKFNFVLLSKSQYQQLESYFKYHIELDEIKELRDLLYDKLKKAIEGIIPSYLFDDMNLLILGYLMCGLRENTIKVFYKLGLIKPNETNKRFNFNMYAWKFSD